VPGSVKQQHAAVKERKRGYDEATFMESVVILNTAEGECVDDFSHLATNPGLVELVGHECGSGPEILHAFHEAGKIQQAQQRRLPGAIAYISEENRALRGWAESLEI
jgi:hypothetical protein